MGRPKASKAEQQLQALARELEQGGADPIRIDTVRCAQRFKRSWVELAAALVRVRDTHAYERWGYPDLHAYCAHELHLKAPTVDKLVLSYSTLERHAPQVLARDGVQEPIPSYQAIHYYAQALDDEPAARGRAKHVEVDPQTRAEALGALHHAVFEEGEPVVALRRRFDPVLRPKPPEVQAQESVQRLKGAITRVSELLVQVDGLDQTRIEEVEAVLDRLRQDLEALTAAQARPATATG